MKIRFYHWWIYRLFRYFWTPIFESRPKMARFLVNWMTRWSDAAEHSEKISKEE